VIQLSSDVNYGHPDAFNDVIYDIAHPMELAQSGPHDFVNNSDAITTSYTSHSHLHLASRATQLHSYQVYILLTRFLYCSNSLKASSSSSLSSSSTRFLSLSASSLSKACIRPEPTISLIGFTGV
jgi:hypothetical protein